MEKPRKIIAWGNKKYPTFRYYPKLEQYNKYTPDGKGKK